MEHRRENRFKPNQAVTVRILGLRLGPLRQASILDVSGSGTRLRCKLPLQCGTPIEIETDNTVMRGKVCRCEPKHGSYEIGVQLSETGSSTSSASGISRLGAALQPDRPLEANKAGLHSDGLLNSLEREKIRDPNFVCGSFRTR